MGGVSNTEHNTINSLRTGTQVAMGYALVFGFAAAALVWTAWFVTHLPWLGIAESVRVGTIMLVWISAAALLSRACTLKTSIAGGCISALLGLLILGTAGEEHRIFVTQ